VPTAVIESDVADENLIGAERMAVGAPDGRFGHYVAATETTRSLRRRFTAG
jgi:hypothetical protein